MESTKKATKTKTPVEEGKKRKKRKMKAATKTTAPSLRMMMMTDTMKQGLAMYISFEKKFLKSSGEVVARQSLQEMTTLFAGIPLLARFISNARILQMGRSKRKVNPKHWNPAIAKVFGMLVATHTAAARSIARPVPTIAVPQKPIRVVNVTETGPIRKRGRYKAPEKLTITAPPVSRSVKRTALTILAKTACPTPTK